MPPAKASTAPTRKRNRKRKRRAPSSASSSVSSSSSEDESPATRLAPAAPTRIVIQTNSDSESSSSSSSSSSESSSDSEASASVKSVSGLMDTTAPAATTPKRRRDSRSPSPPSAALPSFLPVTGTEGAQQREEELRARFRKFWMANIADGFKDDLEELHKEPNLTESRLSLLIDSLASGADVFMAGSSGSANRGLESVSGANEMEIVLEGAM